LLLLRGGFDDPWDLDNTSWIPTDSKTERTAPPAITPVPWEAGIKNTRAPPYLTFVREKIDHSKEFY
jgi:hypothetical protein